MKPRTSRILRILFAIFGWLMAILFIMTEGGAIVFWIIFKPASGPPEGIRGGLIYLAISLVCFYARWRLNRPAMPL